MRPGSTEIMKTIMIVMILMPNGHMSPELEAPLIWDVVQSMN